MTKAEMKMVGDECDALARTLADRQDDDVTLKPREVQRLVNALINSGNCFKDILAGRIDPVAGGFVEKSETPAV